MQMINCCFQRAAQQAVALVFLAAAILPLPALVQAAGIDPQAEKLLKASTDFLASQQRFSAFTHSTIEAVLTSGQKLQFDHYVELVAQRPNKLRARRIGDLVDQDFYYDGKSLTLYNPGEKYYATVEAPGTIEEMLDFARETLDIVGPAGDLVYRNAFDILMQDVTNGFVVGKGIVEGILCDHLAFRSPHVDWQIWIEDGDRPLPRKLVITSRDVANAPQFQVVMSEWNLAPETGATLFKFMPNKGHEQIDFLPIDDGDSGTQ